MVIVTVIVPRGSAHFPEGQTVGRYWEHFSFVTVHMVIAKSVLWKFRGSQSEGSQRCRRDPAREKPSSSLDKRHRSCALVLTFGTPHSLCHIGTPPVFYLQFHYM